MIKNNYCSKNNQNDHPRYNYVVVLVFFLQNSDLYFTHAFDKPSFINRVVQWKIPIKMMKMVGKRVGVRAATKRVFSLYG